MDDALHNVPVKNMSCCFNKSTGYRLERWIHLHLLDYNESSCLHLHIAFVVSKYQLSDAPKMHEAATYLFGRN